MLNIVLLVSPKMFTNERLFTIQRLLYQDSTVPIIILKGRIENIQSNIIIKNLSASSKSGKFETFKDDNLDVEIFLILPFSIIAAVPSLVQQCFSTNNMHFRKSCFDMKIFSSCISRQVQFQQIFGHIRLYLMSLIYGYVLRLYGGQPENGGGGDGMRRAAKDLLRYGGNTLYIY